MKKTSHSNVTFRTSSGRRQFYWLFLISLLLAFPLLAQNTDNLPVREYTLTVDEGIVNKTGKPVKGMTVNGGIPGPTLRFAEGEYAVIYVTNNMDVETSVHWHGILLPNFFDGVPYLTTPPIAPGTTFKYEFPLIQSGTYWYHSHTMLQEQSGVYGSIVIEPKVKTLDYDTDLVLVLSDWTDERPANVLRNLKRRNEWYNIRKNTATPLNRVIARGALGAQLNFWKQRMEGMDIADIFYPAFLSNGEKTRNYNQFKPGERVRLRIINAAASSQFWLTFGGEDPLLVAADGLDVVPVRRNKTFIAIAETYDFIVTVPARGKMEVRAMAQDGSGHTSTFLGQGETVAAPVVPRPDQYAMMKQMAAMDMRMGAPAMKLNPSEEEPQEMMEDWGMKMDHAGMRHDMRGMKHRKGMEMPGDSMKKQDMKHAEMDHSRMDHGQPNGSRSMEGDSTHSMEGMKMDNMEDAKDGTGGGMDDMDMTGMDMFAEYNYDYLESPERTNIPTDPEEHRPVRRILLNLTGNMWRYIWSMNGVPLSEADKIKIKKGEVVRITLNNLTMMHHPMHLHGHFFRVLNKNGDYSPLKHTVNVAPMQKITIEFDAREYGDWFFHCHVLYHMMAGMARVYSYDTLRDSRMVRYPLKKLLNEGNHFYTWGVADVASHMAHVNLVSSNIRNQFNLRAEYGWNRRMEVEVTYERYLYDYFRVFAGVNVENERAENPDDIVTTAVGGIRFLTPYLVNLDLRIDNRLRPELRLSRELMIFPKTNLFGEFEYRADFGWTNRSLNENTGKAFSREVTWSVGMEYFLSRNVSLMGSYDNRFGAGGGLTVRF
jgi:CopA family copper-resistance protein